MSCSLLSVTLRSRAGLVWPIAVEQRHGSDYLPMGLLGELSVDLAKLHALGLDHRAYGMYLGEALFSGVVRDTFLAALGRANGPLRFILKVEAADLVDVAWEHMCLPIDGQWSPLALSQRIFFAQLVDSSLSKGLPAAPRAASRALVVAASPQDLPEFRLEPFDAAAALQTVQTALGDLQVTTLGPEGVQGPPSLDNLCQHLAGGSYQVLHLICHGRLDRESGETILYLCRNDRQESVAAVSGAILIERLRWLGDALPRFVFLAACETAHREAATSLRGLAQRLVSEAGIPAVLAMTVPVSLQTAGDLAAAFYRQLVLHGEPDRALAEAASGLAGRSDSMVPVLFSRLEGTALFAGAPRPTSDQPLRTVSVVLPDAAELRDVLAYECSLDELDSLCGDVEQALSAAGQPRRVNLDIVGGREQIGKAQNLVRFLQRYGALPYLISALQRARPELFRG